MESKFYGVEIRERRIAGYDTKDYRWYSKYNGARGPWCDYKEDANKGGIQHEWLLKEFHPELQEPLIDKPKD